MNERVEALQAKGWWRNRPVTLRGYLPTTHYYEAGEARSICGRANRARFSRAEQPTVAVWCKSCERIRDRQWERETAEMEAAAERRHAERTGEQR
jgi:hypothetical protein